MSAEALDFIVKNTSTGQPVAAFLLPTDALTFIKFRRTKAPKGPLFDISNADGTPTSAHLVDAVERANAFNLFKDSCAGLGEDQVKVHLHEEQFDGHPHPWCGRGDAAVTSEAFEATAPELRCQICDREWFPRGQPDWHYQHAARKLGRAP